MGKIISFSNSNISSAFLKFKVFNYNVILFNYSQGRGTNLNHGTRLMKSFVRKCLISFFLGLISNILFLLQKTDVQVSTSSQAELKFYIMFNTPQVILITIGYSANLQRTITQKISFSKKYQPGHTYLHSLHSKGLTQQLLKLQLLSMLLDTQRKDTDKARFCRISIFRINRYSQENKTSFRTQKTRFVL